MYQQSAFGENFPSVRSDCLVRYNHILMSLANDEGISDVTGFSILDFGCAEGYFGFSFLKDGASSCTFIDNDDGCLKTVDSQAIRHGFISKVKVYPKLPENDNYDLALCLDLWSENGVPSASKFATLTNILFISTSGDGSQKNKRLEEESSKSFKSVKPIYTGYQGRTIYRCSK